MVNIASHDGTCEAIKKGRSQVHRNDYHRLCLLTVQTHDLHDYSLAQRICCSSSPSFFSLELRHMTLASTTYAGREPAAEDSTFSFL